MNKIYTSPWLSIKKIFEIVVRFFTLLPIAIGALVIAILTLTPNDGHKLTKFKIKRIKFFYRCKIWIYRHMRWFCRATYTEDYFKDYDDRYGMQLSNKSTD